MSVVAIRDGMIAADTAVTIQNDMVGQMKKIGPVHEDLGGGYIGLVGESHLFPVAMKGMASGDLDSAMEAFSQKHPDGDVRLEGLWLTADGVVCHLWEKWFPVHADYHAIGGGYQYALGAFAMGASAIGAVQAACKFSSGCGGMVNSYHIKDLEPKLTVNETNL